VIALIIWALIEWRFTITKQYISDLQSAVVASGAIRSGVLSLLKHNSTQFILALTATYLLYSSRVVRWPDILFVTFVCTAGLLILNQNAQEENIVVILAVLLWSYSKVAKKANGNEAHLGTIAALDVRIMGIFLALFMAPPLINNLVGIRKLTLGLSKGEQLSQVSSLPGVYIDEKLSYLDNVRADADPVLLFNELRSTIPLQPLSQSEYVETINEGLKLLHASKVSTGKIVTFDLANPFNFLTGGSPSEGDYSWFHARRDISSDSHLPALELFRDVKYIMMPTFPMAYFTKKTLLEIYAKDIDREFVIVAKSKSWTLYSKRQS